MLWPKLLLVYLWGTVLCFDPTEYNFRIRSLLTNVLEEILNHLGKLAENRLDLLNFIGYSEFFITHFDKYKYIIQVDEDEFQRLNEHMIDVQQHLPAYQWLHKLKIRIADQWRLVNQILKRHQVYSLYLLETKRADFIMIIDTSAGYGMDDLKLWISEYQSLNFKNQRSWCVGIAYSQIVKFVKYGEDVSQSCEELEMQHLEPIEHVPHDEL